MIVVPESDPDVSSRNQVPSSNNWASPLSLCQLPPWRLALHQFAVLDFTLNDIF